MADHLKEWGVVNGGAFLPLRQETPQRTDWHPLFHSEKLIENGTSGSLGAQDEEIPTGTCRGGCREGRGGPQLLKCWLPGSHLSPPGVVPGRREPPKVVAYLCSDTGAQHTSSQTSPKGHPRVSAEASVTTAYCSPSPSVQSCFHPPSNAAPKAQPADPPPRPHRCLRFPFLGKWPMVVPHRLSWKVILCFQVIDLHCYCTK